MTRQVWQCLTVKKINMAKATGRLKVLAELTHGGCNLAGNGWDRSHTLGNSLVHRVDINAHPHFNEDGTIAVVHNGIIENYLKLKEKAD